MLIERNLTELLTYLKKCEKKHGIFSPVLSPDEMTLLISVVTLAEAEMQNYIKKYEKEPSKEAFIEV